MGKTYSDSEMQKNILVWMSWCLKCTITWWQLEIGVNYWLARKWRLGWPLGYFNQKQSLRGLKPKRKFRWLKQVPQLGCQTRISSFKKNVFWVRVQKNKNFHMGNRLYHDFERLSFSISIRVSDTILVHTSVSEYLSSLLFGFHQ